MQYVFNTPPPPLLNYHSSSTGYFPVRQAVQCPTLLLDLLPEPISWSFCCWEATPSCTADSRPSTVRYCTLAAPAQGARRGGGGCGRLRRSRTVTAPRRFPMGQGALTDVFGQVLELGLVGDELLLGWDVDAHVAGEPDRRGGHPDVDLTGGGTGDDHGSEYTMSDNYIHVMHIKHTHRMTGRPKAQCQMSPS